MSTSEKTYHHGDLRAALLTAAIASLEGGEQLSMRAVARRAGVSQTAPYRHFADRAALDAAVAVEGFTDLTDELSDTLAALPDDAAAADVLGALGIAYVGFALRRPAVFRLMFGNECDPADGERVQAAGQLHALLGGVTARLFPGVASPAIATGMWSVAHGLAFLHLDGKLRPEPSDDVAERIRAAIGALLAAGAVANAPASGS
ncbi:TetR/AcrR family transcriptional regulator [Microbacterium sp. Au-Mic1]|uniref:TetR/AcrR family transcriptional regulator n=1 Tax=Microbacterium sp. Au-Mic1 TaxID=2906457 RepID=UPI001E5C4DD6|nr:TetR/AcrR family transcriptional regulator [Microbacterium sp. Au-Mic1]MCE4026879.1 TetR/AcrR family transcriptional regulator [Microbacterium sp. Au-Mic1]